MANRYLLLGHEVSKEIYEKYSNEKFSFMGRSVSLDGIHIWATDEEIGKQFPQYAAEARKIVEKIEKEITEQSKPKGKYQNFHSFLEALQTIYREEKAVYDRVHNAFGIAQREYEATTADSSAPEYIKLIARGDYERAKLTFEQDRQKAQDSYRERVGQLRQQMVEFSENLYRATPERIDQNAMQLLSMGIITSDEMEHMAGKYVDNPPMLRIIGQYAKQKAESFGPHQADKARPYNLLSNQLRKLDDSGAVLTTFDSMAKFGQEGLGKDAAIARIHEQHWDRLYATARESYDNFIIQPSAGSEE